MNLVRFIKPDVKEGKRYRAKISRYDFNERQRVLYLYVTIDKMPNIEFFKRIEVDFRVNSMFADWCQKMNIYFDDDTADLDELVGVPVFVYLKKGNDEEFYVNKIQLIDEPEYEKN